VIAVLPSAADRTVGGRSGWLACEVAALRALDSAIDRDAEVSELRLARDMTAYAGADGLLFIGSSMPIRHLDLAMAAGLGPRVLANRGVSGIDGGVSTAVGAALAHRARGGAPSSPSSVISPSSTIRTVWSSERTRSAPTSRSPSSTTTAESSSSTWWAACIPRGQNR
jgi:2-succinyl-5-enolpyruvyl-6-hydroxy-3-cyclohexene-1-carboxylate synthase